MKRTEMKKFIQSLSAAEAFRVLNDILDNDSAILEKAYETAVKVAEDVYSTAIMNKVFSRLARNVFLLLNLPFSQTESL